MALKDMKINTKDYYIWGAMVFNATFNNISVISWRSITLVFITSTLKCAAFKSKNKDDMSTRGSEWNNMSTRGLLFHYENSTNQSKHVGLAQSRHHHHLKDNSNTMFRLTIYLTWAITQCVIT